MSLTAALDRYAAAALAALRPRVAATSIDAEQRAAHGYAWMHSASPNMPRS